VLGLPEGATALATSERDGHHAFRWGDAAWGVQFHPEFSTAHMRGYLHARRDALAREGRDPAAMIRAVSAAPRARGILRRFVREARKRARLD
jgi:GMP synthase (glutamine-hydrolysing)